MNLRIKVLNPQLETLSLRQEMIAGYDNSMEQLNLDIERSEKQLAKLINRQEEAKVRVEHNSKIQSSVRRLQNELAQGEAVRKEYAQKVSAYKLELDPILQDSIEQLNSAHSDFDAQVSALRESATLQKKAFEKLTNLRVEHECKIQSSQSRVASLQGRLAALQEDREKRAGALKALAKKFNFDPLNLEAGAKVELLMQSALDSARSSLESGRRGLDSKVADFSAQSALVSGERVSLSRQEAQTKLEMKRAEKDLESRRKLGGQKAEIESSLQMAQKTLSDTQKSIGSIELVESELVELQIHKSKLESSLSQLSDSLAIASTSAGIEERAKMRRATQEAKQEQLKAVESKCSKTLLRLTRRKSMPDYGELPKIMRETIEACREEMRGLGGQLEAEQTKRVTLESQLNSVQTEISSLKIRELELESQLNSIISDVESDNSSGSVQERLDDVEATLREDASRVVELEMCKTFYERFHTHANSAKECQVCGRGFESAKESAEFIKNLRARVDESERGLAPAKKAKLECESVLDYLRPALPIDLELKRIQERLRVLNAEETEKRPGLKALSETVAAMRIQISESEQDLLQAQKLQNVVQDLVRLSQEHLKAETEAVEAESACETASGGLSVAEIRAQMQTAQKENEIAGKELSSKRRGLDQTKVQLRKHEQEVSRLMQQLMDCDSSAESTSILAERLTQLTSALASTQALKTAADSNLKLAQQAKDQAVEELELFLATERSKLDAQEHELAQFRTELALSTGGGDTDVGAVQKDLAVAEKTRDKAAVSLEEFTEQFNELRNQLDQTNKKLNESQLERKNLDSNLKYRAAKTQLSEQEAKISAKRAELNSFGSSEALESIEKDQSELSDLTGKIERMGGHQDTLRTQAADYAKKIKEAHPSKVQKETQEKMIELEATKLAIKDLGN